MTNTTRSILLGMTLVAILGAIVWLERTNPTRKEAATGGAAVTVTAPIVSEEKTVQQKATTYPRAIELANPSGFLNTQPFRIGDLVGKKIILVDFWTYSCINCQRTTPYLNSWYNKYHDKGLEIVGVHTPEFDFEKNKDNVASAIKKFGIKYPVVQDNDYGTWRAYQNQYWPHKYLIDIDGFIVYDHIGEGGYDETEKEIQRLLSERMTALGEQGAIAQDIVRPSMPSMDLSKVASPETYFGSTRNELLGNGVKRNNGIQTLSFSKTPEQNTLYLSGTWDIQPEHAVATGGDLRVTYRYSAQDVYMVASAKTSVNVEVFQDGKLVEDAAGEDVQNGVATIQAERLYTLIHNPDGYGEHTLELRIKNPGLNVYTFTFG